MELLKRDSMQNSLLEWATFLMSEKGMKPAKHHLLLLDKLQAITDGKLLHSKTGLPCKNLMILMPPGAAKSTYTSVAYPLWFLQRWPHLHPATPTRILACSYASDLIESFSRECRNGVELYSQFLGYELCKDSRAVQEWTCSHGASYRCGGVGAGIAGRRADAGVIDDYLGSQEDADSKTVRDKQWAWYWGDFVPRLKPDAIRIIIANRRHEDDLVGRLLEKQSDEWEVISIPFFAEQDDCLGRQPGDVLWPEWFNEAKAKEIRFIAETQPRIFAGLYQQRPSPEQGNYFQAEWLLEYSREEYQNLSKKDLLVYGAGDWAVSEEKDADRSCFGGVAMDTDGTLYVLPDLFWKKAAPKELLNNFIDFLARRKPMEFWSEKGHISKSWGPFLREMMLERNVFSHITEVTPSRNKEVRAQSIRGRMSLGRVKFPSFATWWPQARHELLLFPGGKHDDFVDFLGHIGMGINSVVRSSPVKVQASEDIVSGPPITMRWLKKSHKEQARAGQALYNGN